MTKDKYFRENYHDVCKLAFESGKLDFIKQNSGVYTTEMIAALRDMAENDVYPDGTFGDDECVVWSMFHCFHMCK